MLFYFMLQKIRKKGIFEAIYFIYQVFWIWISFSGIIHAKIVKFHITAIPENRFSYSSSTSDYMKLSIMEDLRARLGYVAYAEKCSGVFFFRE